MESKQISKNQIELFCSLFQGRSDAYGEGNGHCTKEALTDDVLMSHLNGRKRIGIYPLSSDILDGEGTFWSVIDIDDKENDRLSEAIAAKNILSQYRIEGYIERSKSKGFHVWVFFNEAIEASKARMFMQHVINIVEKDTGYRITEIFPKQDSIDPNDKDSFGNYINLPLFGNDITNGRTVFLNPDNSFEPYADQWQFLSAIEKVSKVQVDDLIKQYERVSPEVVPAKEDKSSDPNNWQIMHLCFQEMIKGVGEGNRNNVAFVLAKHLRIKDFPQNATLTILLNVWNPNNKPPMNSREITNIVEDVYQWKKGRGYAGLGCKEIGQFCGKEKCIVYRKYWEIQSTPSSRYFDNGFFVPKLLADELLEEHSFINAGDQIFVYQEGVYKPIGEIFIRQKTREILDKKACISCVKEIVEHIRDCTFVEADKLNTHTDLINLPEGMLNWRTMELLPHSESYLSTIRIPVEYNPEAQCPMIDKFLEEILPPDCVPLVLEIIGYCLIVDTRYSFVYIFHGKGSNGKTLLSRLTSRLIGKENLCSIPLQELDGNRFKRADLVGKLVNIFSDLSNKPIESSSYLKMITGGDQIDIERKNKDPKYVTITAKLLYSCNEIPKSGGDQSWGFYRRLMILPFPNQFTGKNADKNLLDKLTQPKELSGFLNKSLIALKRLFEQDGFTEAKSSLEMLERYRKRNDPTSAFVTDSCSLDDINARTERGNLYINYSRYCKDSEYKRDGRNDFYERIRNYPGIREGADKDGVFFFEGIKLTSKSSSHTIQKK